MKNKKLIYSLQIVVLFAFIFNPWTKFPYTFLLLSLIVLLICYAEDRNFSAIGLNNSGTLLKLLLQSIGLFLIVEPLMDFIIQPLVNKLSGEIPDYSAFQVIENDTKRYLKYLVYIWISAAFGEELFFRGFLNSRLSEIFSGLKGNVFIIAVLSSLLFAAPHFYLGAAGVCITFLFGLLFFLIYRKTGLNLWMTILLHGFIDTFFITMAYTGNLSYYSMVNLFS
nr:CPBP family intramembrane glutamic endopeptidase [uncultured Lacibacter sp.]